MQINYYPSASAASREVANLTERKINIPPYMVSKNLSVRLSAVNFDPNYLRTGKTEWANKNLGHLWQKDKSQNFLYEINYFLC